MNTGGMEGPPAMYKTRCHSIRKESRPGAWWLPPPPPPPAKVFLLLELCARENGDAEMGASCSGGVLVLLRKSLPEV